MKKSLVRWEIEPGGRVSLVFRNLPLVRLMDVHGRRQIIFVVFPLFHLNGNVTMSKCDCRSQMLSTTTILILTPITLVIKSLVKLVGGTTNA
ncbi:hypothetical protein YC2023_116885 [Brassica napus]